MLRLCFETSIDFPYWAWICVEIGLHAHVLNLAMASPGLALATLAATQLMGKAGESLENQRHLL